MWKYNFGRLRGVSIRAQGVARVSTSRSKLRLGLPDLPRLGRFRRVFQRSRAPLMKLQYRRRAVTASLAVAAAAVGLAVTAPAAHASPEDPTHGVVGSYSATQPGDIVVDSATHRGYITQYGGPTSSLSVVDTNTGKSVGTIDASSVTRRHLPSTQASDAHTCPPPTAARSRLSTRRPGRSKRRSR